MDFVGIGMCLATLPMAAFTALSVLAAVLLVLLGAANTVALGVAAILLCLPLAIVLERLVVSIDDSAIRLATRGAGPSARLIAIVSGGLPMLVILTWEFLIFRQFVIDQAAAPRLLLWLWSYGVATGPWTLFALRVSRFRRTLCGIRAYAGHLAYWLLTVALLAFGLGPVGGVVAMALPAILPFTVGLLLALADRDALTNVRV